MKICKKCNKVYEEDMNYCPYCGTKYHDYHDDLKEAMDELFDENESNDKPKEKRNEKDVLDKILLFLVIAILVVVLSGIWMMISKSKDINLPTLPNVDENIDDNQKDDENNQDLDNEDELDNVEQDKVIDITNDKNAEFQIVEFKVTKNKNDVRFDVKSQSSLDGDVYLKDGANLNVGPIRIHQGSGSFYFVVNGKVDYILSFVSEKGIYEYHISKEMIQDALKE
ncbi:MAG: hypothetical protein ACI4U3_01255 [Traorella sp.]